MSDAQFIWGPNATDQDVAIGNSEAQTPDFGFHKPYDARHLPPEDSSACATCAGAKKKDDDKKDDDQKDDDDTDDDDTDDDKTDDAKTDDAKTDDAKTDAGKTDGGKDWKDWGYRPQCPASGPPLAGGDGTSMSAPPPMTPAEQFESYNKLMESHELSQERLNSIGEAMNKTMNQSQEQLEQLDRWNEMDRQMREMEMEMP